MRLSVPSLLLSCLLVFGCADDDANHAPTAVAGPDQNVATGTRVTLDAAASSDLDGDPLVYFWVLAERPAGSGAVLAYPRAVRPTFVADVDGQYVLGLTVSDSKKISAPDRVTVTAATVNSAPVAVAGVDQRVAVGSGVTLDGSGCSDADGDLLSYAWSLVDKPPGSAATLAGADGAAPRFTPDMDGDYVIELVVSDGEEESVPDSVRVVAAVANSAPVAAAGTDLSVAVNSIVTLDGSGSSDADGDLLNYCWSLLSAPDGSAAALTGGDGAAPSFTPDLDGDYVIQLIVSDGAEDSAPDSVLITAATANSAPVAAAGTDRNVAAGSVVALDGSASGDADGDPLGYNWSFVSRPAGSRALLSSTNVPRPTFVPDVAGTYVLQLIVNDGAENSAPDRVTVVAAGTANSTPVAFAGADRNVPTGSVVVLDGSGSSDADGDPLSYAWSFVARPAGSAAVLVGATGTAPSFVVDVDGAYVVRLIVSDGARTSVDSVTVTAATANSAPVAAAGADRNVLTGSLVTLDGSGSSDADGDPLSYAWSLVSVPAGSAAALSDSTAAGPTFTADLDGDYVVRLVVNDGTIDSAPDTVTIAAGAAWSPVERIIDADALPAISSYLSHPVPVRFDADTVHLYFAGTAFKAYATVPAFIYRIVSTDNGATWSAPEPVPQLEGNYMSYPSAFVGGKLLLVWHNGSHAELYHTDLASAAAVPAMPWRYVSYATIGREINWASHWNGALVGMWHPTASVSYGPFVGTMEPSSATLSGIPWPFGGIFLSPTPISDTAALVLTDGGLYRTGFDGSAFAAPHEPLPFPDADPALNYGGTTFHNAAYDPASGYLYFTGYSLDGSRSALYRVKLLL